MKYLISLLLTVTVLNLSARTTKDRRNFDSPYPLWGYMSVPMVNVLEYRPADTLASTVGGFGWGAGAGYRYAKNRFYTLHMGVAIGAIPTAKWPDKNGRMYNSTVASYFISLRDNFILGKFDLGYGATLSKHQIGIDDQVHDTLGNVLATKLSYYNNWGLGASVASYFRMSRILAGGIIYQPHILSLSNFGFKYEHTIMFDLRISFKRNPLTHPMKVKL
jgi:hypothetical protein